jgi:hypothetical protein
MFSFLEENMKSFNQHFYGAEAAYFGLRIGAKGSNGISYTGRMNNPDMIGFDFNCSGGERMHMFQILKWMSKVISRAPEIYYYDGERSKFGGTIKEDFDHEAAILYDVNKPKKKEEPLEFYQRLVASFGMGVHPVKYNEKGERDGEKTTEEIEKETNEKIEWIENDIKRLDELWTKSLKDESVSV